MNKPLPVIPSQLTSSYIRNSEFQVIIWLYLWTFGDTMWKLLSVSYLSLTQIDLFHLRERDLLRRFAEEVSEYQSRGESKESAFILVRILPVFFFFFSSILLSLSYSLKLFCLPELSARRRIGQSFLRTSNIKNIHGGWVNCTCWFIEGKSNYCLLNIPDIEETHY